MNSMSGNHSAFLTISAMIGTISDVSRANTTN